MTTEHRTLLPLRPQDIQRFWLKVEIEGHDECWEWQGKRDKWNYGWCYPNSKTTRAHRFSYLISRNEDPGLLCVLHSCDNPPCVNPRHLRLGTYADNNKDASERKRFRLGEKHWTHYDANRLNRGTKLYNAKLTEAIVIEARRLNKEEGLGSRRLAKRYGVSRTTMEYALRRKSWTHI